MKSFCNKCILILTTVLFSFWGKQVFAKSQSDSNLIRVEFIDAVNPVNKFIEIPVVNRSATTDGRISTFENSHYRVTIHEIDRGYFTEINGELENLLDGNSCLTLRISFPEKGKTWKWYRGLQKSEVMESDVPYYDTISARTMMPPDGAFNGKTLSDGGYGDRVGQGTISFYPLNAVSIDGKGESLGIDLSTPIVYRLGASANEGLFAEFDIATSPLTVKFPNRAFFKLSHFNFDDSWGMRAALKNYYNIYPQAFKKRVVNEGIWLPFTPLRSIPHWEDFGFAFHETSWNTKDEKDGMKLPTIISDKGTGVFSFQYTEPWDIQLPIKNKNLSYDSIVNGNMIPDQQLEYIKNSVTEDKNGRWQIRRLETPWFTSGWAMSITTNCDPELSGFNRYKYVRNTEVNPAIKLNADGVYFDSMEWNWHHDLNYRSEHFKYVNAPLTFSKDVGRPAIWNFTSEFAFMKKIADEMHSQGKLVMGNGHAWNPFAAANLDLFGAELNWYSSDDHNTDALDFKRAISFQKPIVFLLNEGLNDTAFTKYPYVGYRIYFEKLLAYGFFPSFFSTNASSDPYWQDKQKIENGRPFFKKYIPIIKKIAAAGWQPVTFAHAVSPSLRIERFGDSTNLYFTVRNNGSRTINTNLIIDSQALDISGNISAVELVSGKEIKAEQNKLFITIPAGRTQVIEIK